jgi:hypothetical protein
MLELTNIGWWYVISTSAFLLGFGLYIRNVIYEIPGNGRKKLWIVWTVFVLYIAGISLMTVVKIMSVEWHYFLTNFGLVGFAAYCIRYIQHNHVNDAILRSAGLDISDTGLTDIRLLLGIVHEKKEFRWEGLVITLVEPEKPEEGFRGGIRVRTEGLSTRVLPYQFHEFREEITVEYGGMRIYDRWYWVGETCRIAPMAAHNLELRQEDTILARFYDQEPLTPMPAL